MLHVHPSISLVTEREKILNLGTLGNFRLPLATSSINETDSIVRVGDGQIVAIGGLMTQELRDDRTGLPGLAGLPVVGNLFGQKSKVNRKRELVILIKPTVIPADGRWPAELSAPALPVPPTPERSQP
jgi:MSHA biogenesis protein MshL